MRVAELQAEKGGLAGEAAQRLMSQSSTVSTRLMMSDVATGK
jgi:hypothetical protein